MPLLDKDHLDRMLAKENTFCHQCKRYTRQNYCRQCDEFFQEGHAIDCPAKAEESQTGQAHDGHRTYDLTKTAQENLDSTSIFK